MSEKENNTQRPQHRGPGGPGMVGGEKAKNFKGTWKKLFKFSTEDSPVMLISIVIALLLAVGGTVLTIIGPDRLGKLSEQIRIGIFAETIDIDLIYEMGITLAIIYVGAALCMFVVSFIMATVTAKISKKLRTGVSEKTNKLPLSYFDKTTSGDVISLVTNDIDTIGNTMFRSIDQLIRAVILFFGSLLMMFLNSWVLALVAIVSTLLGFVFMAIMMPKSQKQFGIQQKGLGKINGYIEEVYSGHTVVKAYNAGEETTKIFEEINDTLYDSGWKSQFMSGVMMPIMMFIGNFGYVAVCVVGAALTMLDESSPMYIDFGVIVSFMIYIRLFTQPLSQFAQSMQQLQRTAAASERVFEYFDQDELSDETNKTVRLKNVKGDVEFKNVKFHYSPEKPIINDFSVKVEAGQKVAIVGPTGAGKTTMVNLLMRFYDINGGDITIDGVSINDVTRENVHEQFCMVLQDTWLFKGTVNENIIYSKQDITEEDVVEACKSANVDHFIRTLSDEYEHVLSDKASLSAGQKQLLTIARAMVQDAPLLILDEATSSVDTRTERLVQAAMDKLTEGRTSFVIAHRLSTIKNADLILVMKDGDIIEKGNHNDLLSQNGFYAELYNSQFETN